MTSNVTPWWECLNLRPEIMAADGNINDVQMSVFSVVHQSNAVPYGDVRYYSEITHPTDGLLELMGSVAVRLASDGGASSVKAVWRGDQGMGGGKSHAEVGLFHMANDPAAFFDTPLGKAVAARAKSIAGAGVDADLGGPRVVVLPCDRMDPFKVDKKLDNIADSLGERWLWRLVDGDLNRFNEYKDGLGTPDGIKAAMTAVGGRVLTLIDEILNYVRKATARADETDRAQQDVAFLRDLMEATNTTRHAALVVVMIASDDDTVAMGPFGERIREELDGLFERYGRSIATTTGGDFAEIIRKRLFAQTPAGEVVASTSKAYLNAMDAQWRAAHDGFTWWTQGWDKSVARTYPFHPALLDVIETEWSNKAGFQRVRSTIQIFAAAAHAWSKRARAGEWAPLLIGLGDLPLSDLKVRQSMLDSGVVEDTKTVASRREIAANDVVNSTDDSGYARRVDMDRNPSLDEMNPRIAERIATALWVGSLAPRAQGHVGVTDNELAVAGFVPDPNGKIADVQAMIAQFSSSQGLATIDTIKGLGGLPRRYQLSTRSTLRMFFRAQRETVDNDDTDQRLRSAAQAGIKSGPFDTAAFISAAGHVPAGAGGQALADGLSEALRAGIVDEASTRLYVLDPSRFTLLNGVDSETRAAISSALGLAQPSNWDQDFWPTPHSVAYGSSCVFAVVNTQRRKVAVGSAADLIAWERVAELSAVSGDEGMTAEVKEKLAETRAKFDKHLRSAFQHLIFLGAGRVASKANLSQENQSALDSTTVWKRLVEEDKALDKDQFDRAALLHQLKSGDYGRSIKSVRDDFYRDPDRVLLLDGDTDLKRAIFDACVNGDLEIVSESGGVSVPTRAADINLTSSGNVLDKPRPVVSTPGSDPTAYPVGPVSGVGGTKTSDGVPDMPYDSGSKDTPGGTIAAHESRVVVTIMGTALTTVEERRAAWKMFTDIGNAVDESRVTHATVQFQLTLDTPTAEKIKQSAEVLSAQTTISPIT